MAGGEALSPEAKLAEYGRRIHLQDEDVDYIILLLQEARAMGSASGAVAEREACIDIARAVAANWAGHFGGSCAVSGVLKELEKRLRL